MAFDQGKNLTKSNVKILSAICAFWCTIFGATVFVTLTFKFPVDIIAEPVLAVEILSILQVGAHLVTAVVSSARGRTRVKLKNELKCMVGTAVACTAFHVLAILFGAPAMESSRETFHFAMLLTCLTVVPACCVMGADSERWMAVFFRGRPVLGRETVVWFTSCGALAGAWLGAVPIPLDWDRPWQVWPVSCVLGSLFGYCLGLLLAAIYIPVQYQRLHKHKLT